MTSKTNQNSILINTLLFSICFLPISLALSRFISEIILIIIIINFIILNFSNKDSRRYYKSHFFKIFVLFNFILILSSLLSDSLFSSIRTSIFYFRFGFLVIVIQYLLEFEKRFREVNWENYYQNDPFKISGLALYKWSPIADELKILDKEIVLKPNCLHVPMMNKQTMDNPSRALSLFSLAEKGGLWFGVNNCINALRWLKRVFESC